MFSGGTTNPYDDIVIKTTDENLTSENWELIMNLCDKVLEEGQEGAHNVIASVLKRLAHRSPNVQLYALTLAESLSKNCTIELHRELASKAFTQGLERLITDRNTHEKVRRRALSLIATWTADFENDSTLGVMEDCYNSLKAKNYKFEMPEETPPPTVDDEIRRKEEEELQRVLEMSMQDKGGRGQWSSYNTASSSGAGGSGSGTRAQSSTASTSKPAAATSVPSTGFAQPKYQAGYAPARTPSPVPTTPQTQHFTSHSQSQSQSEYQQQQQQAPAAMPAGATANTSVATMSAQGTIVTRVRALHTFEPTEPGELGFEKGDIIKVVDRGYKDWWRGQLKGRTGIFPVNYVEAMPEPTVAELAKEAEQEAAVFAQAVNVEKLLNMLRSLDPAKDNLADNEEIQELYRSSMALRPKIVKLIDKYSQKRADLVSMNETFVRARTIFDRMMEESLARHTGVYDQQSYRPAQYRRDSRTRPGLEYVQGQGQQYGYGYTSFPTSAASYAGATPPTGPAPGPQGYDPNAAAYAQQQQQLQAQAAAQAQAQAAAQAAQAQAAAQAAQAQSAQPQPGGYAAHGGYVGQQPGVPYGLQGPTPYPAQQSPPQQALGQILQQSPPQQQQQQQSPSPQQHHQIQPLVLPAHDQPQAQPQQIHTHPVQTQPAHVEQVQLQPQAQAQSQMSSPPEQQAGPPYVFSPHTKYGDPNVQAWADYYAKGGRDLAGAVYFISVPGVTSVVPAPLSGPGGADGVQQGQDQQQNTQQQPQQQPQQQAQPLPQQQQRQSVQGFQHPGTNASASLATPIAQSSIDNLPYPGDAAPSDLAYAAGSGPQQVYAQNAQPQQYQQPQVQQEQGSPQHGFSSPSTDTTSTSAASTPSWVLPKRTTPPPHLGGGLANPHDSRPQGRGQSGQASYSGNVTNQFAGMSVSGAGA